MAVADFGDYGLAIEVLLQHAKRAVCVLNGETREAKLC
jgi:hypothetical protein